MSYFNTTNLDGDSLRDRVQKAETQADQIAGFFRTMPRGVTFTPCEVHEAMQLKAPLTSVRRAMTVLTDNGVLIKTGQKRVGIHGHPVHTWKLA